jgi:hypothetical protein
MQQNMENSKTAVIKELSNCDIQFWTKEVPQVKSDASRLHATSICFYTFTRFKKNQLCFARVARDSCMSW